MIRRQHDFSWHVDTPCAGPPVKFNHMSVCLSTKAVPAPNFLKTVKLTQSQQSFCTEYCEIVVLEIKSCAVPWSCYDPHVLRLDTLNIQLHIAMYTIIPLRLTSTTMWMIPLHVEHGLNSIDNVPVKPWHGWSKQWLTDVALLANLLNFLEQIKSRSEIARA